jgi:rRNA maturation endonuclease Nob1
MGFFNKLGRQVESFKRTAEEAAESDTVYECRACEEQFVSEHEECLDCGGELVAVEA